MPETSTVAFLANRHVRPAGQLRPAPADGALAARPSAARVSRLKTELRRHGQGIELPGHCRGNALSP
jgi:hypothetical protein